jgi:aminopeptidase-like protein
MVLERLLTDRGAREAADTAMDLMRDMFPLCRSITGDGVRRTFDVLQRVIPLARHEVPSGTPVFDWEVPKEWNIRDAYVADANGRRVIDFRAHNLHVVNYSVPVRRTLSLEELQPHLHSLPAQPDLIPYRTTYYKEDWGFCLRHRDRERLVPGCYEVVIDASLAPGHLTYAECIIRGRSDDTALVYTHSCHPSLANDNLTGLAAAALLARDLGDEPPRLTWRIVFGPGTIGSLCWLARNEDVLPRLKGGLVVGLLGDPGPLTYKRSRRGATATDRIMEMILRTEAPGSRLMDFEPYGYDERQFCSPGFDLPVGRLTRSPNGAYAQYHTSADDLSLVEPEAIAQSLRVLAAAVSMIDYNRLPLNLRPKGEPRLGKRGLYGAVGGTAPGEFEHALLWVLSLADGRHDLTAITQRSGLQRDLVQRATTALEEAGLVRAINDRWNTARST